MEEKIFDPIERKEFFLANLGGQDITTPDPVTRIERYLQDIIDGNASTIPPITRMEYYLAKISGADVAIPDPVTRTEYYLASIAGMEVDVPDPITREEYFLAEWAENSSEHTYGPAALVSFETTKAKLMKSLLINLPPVQDLHGYDHPWPAGGGVSKCPSFANGTHTTTNGLTVTIQDGEITIDGTASSAGYYTEDIESTVMPADAYVSFNNPVGTYNMAYVFINGNTQIASPSTAPANATKQPTGLSGATVNKLRIFCNAATYDNFKMSPIVHDGSTPQAWQPYDNICPISGRTVANVYVSPTQDVADATTYPVTWQTEAGTVYGGTVDVVTGVLTVDRAIVDLGAQTWHTATAVGHTRFWATITGIAQIPLPNIVAPMLCSNYPTKTANQTYAGTTGVSLQHNSANIYIYDPQKEELSVSDFKTAMNGVQLVYELATPVTYQLTPQTVTALLGQNYVWSDTGDVTVTV